jgi:8-oxo-dGTP diphosphatase
VSEGKVGVGCGPAIAVGGRILLVKRLRPPEARCRNLPSGEVNYLERVEDAIRRETLEETSLTVRLMQFLQLTRMIGQEGQHWLSSVWLAGVEGGEADNLEPDKAEAVTWFPLGRPAGSPGASGAGGNCGTS